MHFLLPHQQQLLLLQQQPLHAFDIPLHVQSLGREGPTVVAAPASPVSSAF